MTALGAAHGAGTWIGIALYAGLALLALRWAIRLAEPPRDGGGPEAGAPPH